MGIHPSSPITPANETQWNSPRPSDESHESQPAKARSGNDPIPEPPPTRRSLSSSELPQDEVEVQRDSQADDQIVVRYMDDKGNLILQVPSQQVLSVAHAIGQDLQREQKARTEAAAPESHGGKPDGH
jgi:hypothetical protein